MNYKWTISGGRAARYKDHEITKYDTDARLGFFWWFWIPKIHTNKGKFKYREVFDINFHWLCFWFALTAWPQKRKR